MVDGNEVWEALFGILEGDVPDKITDAVCDQLAEAVNSVNAATPTPPTLSEDLRKAAQALMDRWPTDQHQGSPLYEEANNLRAALAQVKAS